ncbi:MAG: hypothetical protein CVT99_03390 [Bacteroidetes bacterium HGW-Bacteroidetes-16]|jgi:hypothetical protein|nr:MAG: hypothetical protein CVT99_03390 [Bacteroidetes bacterium HGW-Bacteroidetes-16]
MTFLQSGNLSSDMFPLFLLASGVPNLSGFYQPERLNTAPKNQTSSKQKIVTLASGIPYSGIRKFPTFQVGKILNG